MPDGVGKYARQYQSEAILNDTELQSLKDSALEAVSKAQNLQELENLKAEYLGKKGKISSLLRGIGELPAEERPAYAAKVNGLRDAFESNFKEKLGSFSSQALEQKLSSEVDDISLPDRGHEFGTVHPVAQTWEELVLIFAELGFSWAEGPDIEDDWYNFTALNMPEEHPARQMHDTFYMSEPGKQGLKVLRTHTSPVQIRTMQKQKPPIRVIIPGRTYRSDYDMTHTPMFSQLEGLMVDSETHFGHLKGLLVEVCRRFFQIKDLPVRFRPSFFPFTEPSAEVDIGCSRKNGKLEIGGGEGWLEILGCGMVHPQVLTNAGIDPKKYQGFAFGMGIERLAMLKYGIADLRSMFDCDIRWLKHYGISPFDVPVLPTKNMS